MGVPSVVKITKNGVEYTSKCDIVKYTMRELTKRALVDVGRFIINRTRTKARGINRWMSKAKHAPKRYQQWYRSREQDLVLGIENKKSGADTAWWADQSELGTAKQPKRALLHDTVLENIDTIKEIESQYLSYMNNEAQAMAAIKDIPEGDVQE